MITNHTMGRETHTLWSWYQLLAFPISFYKLKHCYPCFDVPFICKLQNHKNQFPLVDTQRILFVLLNWLIGQLWPIVDVNLTYIVTRVSYNERRDVLPLGKKEKVVLLEYSWQNATRAFKTLKPSIICIDEVWLLTTCKGANCFTLTTHSSSVSVVHWETAHYQQITTVAVLPQALQY